jgi:hypothetical protein
LESFTVRRYIDDTSSVQGSVGREKADQVLGALHAEDLAAVEGGLREALGL